MKNILVQKIPTDDNGTSLMSLDDVLTMHNLIKDSLPDDYIIITTPTEIIKVDGDCKIIYIDCKSYSINELNEIIEKAEMYDGLCK